MANSPAACSNRTKPLTAPLPFNSPLALQDEPVQLVRISALAACCFLVAASAFGASSAGLTWPDGQVLPHFAAPADSLDAIDVASLTYDEQLTFAALVGHVNRRQPRIALLNRRSEEGRDTWFRTPTVDVELNEPFDHADKLDLVAKYAGELSGVVLYDWTANPHMRNLASTVAGLRNALPATRELHEQLREHGIELPVVEDLTPLELAAPIETYQHLYRAYWPECEKRFIVSARPEGRGDYHHTRDLAAACGAAAVWLDCRDPDQRELFGRFLADMPAGNAVVLGWHATERSGVTAATRFGVGTMPSDHFMNATVLAGSPREIKPPPAPPSPSLESKLYVTIFLSDGDNIQYAQHAMRRLWDRTADVRGRMPLNWTIAPGLVDIAPGILNYYYAAATPNDCFVCGPSGMGYAMPVNTLAEPGAPLGNAIDDDSRFDAYAQLTSRYLDRAGLRVVTVWDDLTPSQRQSYERHCPNLLGVTVQNFRDDPSVKSSVENDRLRFERLEIPYAGSYDDLRRSIESHAARHDGTAPSFVAYQADAWSPLKPERLVHLMTELENDDPQIEFVRADHYFELQRQARQDAKER
jgi:hypothetical protein